MSGAPSVDADGGIVGNVYDKYGSRNPVARRLMRGFLAAVTQLYARVEPRSVLEVGCGEGLLASHLIRSTPLPARFIATDVSLGQISEQIDPRIELAEVSVYDLPYDDASLDLVVCCEVLEHLQRPRTALAQLARVASRAVLLSTPREPLWRLLNLVRGKYLTDLGNTPGHTQHFSKTELVALARRELQIEAVRCPLPWTVVLGRPRGPR